MTQLHNLTPKENAEIDKHLTALINTRDLKKAYGTVRFLMAENMILLKELNEQRAANGLPPRGQTDIPTMGPPPIQKHR